MKFSVFIASLLLLLSSHAAWAALSLTVSPSAASYAVGQSLTVTVTGGTAGTSYNLQIFEGDPLTTNPDGSYALITQAGGVGYNNTVVWGVGQTSAVFTVVFTAAAVDKGRYIHIGDDNFAEEFSVGPIQIVLPPPTRLYVNAGVATSGDGLSWNTAFKTIEEATTYPNNAALTEIFVANGLYTPTATLSMLNNVGIYGGFAGVESTTANRTLTYPLSTTISGGGTMQVFNNTDLDNTAILDGFVITGGAGTTGGGMYNEGTSFARNTPTIINCAFVGNTATNGGAIGNQYSKPTLTNCVFLNNSATNGGVVYNTDPSSSPYDSSPVFTNCSFQGNAASGTGSITYDFIFGSSLVNCVLWNNGGNEFAGRFTTTSVRYSLFSATISSRYTDGGNNLTTTVSPFVSATDLRLNGCNPALNAGDNAAYTAANGPATDLSGATRIFGTTIDMGAFELQTAPTVGPARLYVNAAAPANGDGLTWNTAFTDLQSALTYTRCGKAMSEIWVAGGTYKPTTTADRGISFAMLPGVAIYGGFSGGETSLASRVLTYPSSTKLSGDIGTAGDNADNSYHVISNPAGLTTTAVLDGFVITVGNANGTNGYEGDGGGMFSLSSNPTIRNCTFQGNSAANNGGAMFNVDSSPVLTNCAFQGNSGNRGGAIANNTSSPTLTNCSFQGNSSTSDGGAIYSFVNPGASPPTLTNCVLFDNGGSKALSVREVMSSNTPLINATYCLFDATVTGYTASATNKITSVSPFISAGSVALNGCNPAINAGDNTAYATVNGPTTDVAGKPRLFNNTIDIGAVELQSAPVSGPARLYVKANASATGQTGLDWDHAFTDLQSALNYYCTPNLTEIWIAGGTYKPTAGTDRTASFKTLPGVAMYGGFPDTGNPTFAQRNPASLPTILSGDIGTANTNTDNSYHVVVFTPGSGTAVLDGVTIYGGNANGAGTTGANIDDYGGGATIYSENGTNSPRLNNVTFDQNTGNGTGGLYTGAYDANGNAGTVNPVLTNCLFTNNTSAASGGGAYFDAGDNVNATSKVTLTGCTFRANKATGLNDGRGGAFIFSLTNANLGGIDVSNCVFENNTADDGGAIFADYGAYTITNSQFRRNTATGTNDSSSDGGGAVYIDDHAKGVIDGCLFDANTAPNYVGGALVFDGDTDYPLALTNTTFTNNTATGYGGALYVYDVGLSVTGCTFKNNTTTGSRVEYGDGGAVYDDYTTLFVGCSFIGNTAAAGYNGGGIYVNDDDTKLINCVFTGNTATKGGAVYDNYNDNLQIVNTTIAGNTARQGGGVYNYFENGSGDVVLTNSIVWNNTATLGAANERQVFNDVGGSSTHKNALVQDGLPPGSVDQGGNLSADPLFVSTTDLQLTPCSPAVDAANSAAYLAAGGGTTDLAGTNRYFGPTLDMGAYELQRARSLALVIATQPVAGSAVCAGVTITASVSVTGAVTSYQWYKGTTPVNGQTTATLSLPNPQPADAGSYVAVVTGSCAVGTTTSVTSTAFSLTVNAPTTITSQPVAGSVVCLNTPVRAGVIAGGTGPFTYQWYQDGLILPGQTSATLTRNTAGVGQSGSYVAIVTGACTSVTSTSFNLTVVSALTARITASPGLTICSGTSTTLTASGGTSYAWNTGQTTAAISVTAGGTYSVTATTAGCTSVTSAVVSQEANTSIVTQPAAGSLVCLNTPVRAGVVAAGTGPFAYQWYQDGLILANQTGATLTRNTAGVGQSGSYVAVVTGACNSVTSTAFSLTVVNQLAVSISPVSPTICAGTSTTLTASGGASYVWNTGQTTAAISVSAAGPYSVTALISGCSAVTATTLTVLQPVVITSQPAAGSLVCAGTPVRTGVLVSGTGPFTYQWYQDGLVIPNQTDATLTRTTAQTSQSGRYTVTITGGCGAVTSTAFSLTVVAPPTVSISPANPTLCPGTSTTLTASGGTSYLWSGGQTTAAIPVNTGGIYSVTATTSGCSSVTTATVTVSSATVALITPSSSTICPGTSTTLTASGGGTFAWSNGNNTAAIVVSPVSTTAYSVTVTNGPGCVGMTSATVTVSPGVTALISPVSQTITSGTSATLTASGGTGYSWSNGSTTAAIVVNPTSTTAYSVTVTNGPGCTGSTSAQVTVLPAAPATLTITSFTCLTTNSVLTGVDFVVGYSNGSFTPALPDLFLNGVTATGQLGQPYSFGFDANQSTIAVQDQVSRSTYFTWNYRAACVAKGYRIGVEAATPWQVVVLNNPPAGE